MSGRATGPEPPKASAEAIANANPEDRFLVMSAMTPPDIEIVR